MTDDSRESGEPGLLQQSDRSAGWRRIGDTAAEWLARIRPTVKDADEAYERGRIYPPGDHRTSREKKG